MVVGGVDTRAGAIVCIVVFCSISNIVGRAVDKLAPILLRLSCVLMAVAVRTCMPGRVHVAAHPISSPPSVCLLVGRHVLNVEKQAMRACIAWTKQSNNKQVLLKCLLLPACVVAVLLCRTALPTLDIAEGALNKLIDTYKKLLPQLGGYLTHAGVCMISNSHIPFTQGWGDMGVFCVGYIGHNC